MNNLQALHSYIRSRASQSRGLSLLELLVTVTLIGVFGYFTVPRMIDLQDSFNGLNAKASLLQDIKRAQAQSITEGCRGVFEIEGDNKSYSFGCDYLAYDVEDPPSHDATTFVRHLPSNILIEAAAPIIFNSKGQTVDVNFIISSNTILLRNATTEELIGSGTLLGTGVFAYD